MKNDIKILHVYFKESGEHKYFGSVKVIFDDHTEIEIGISKDMLYKHDFIAPFVNDKVIIRQSSLIRSRKN